MSNNNDKEILASTNKKNISKSMIQIETLDGGAIESYKTGNKVFRSAYVTDTRLMGVLSIGITWDLPDNKFKKHFHQFFYIDVEDYGLERYDSILGEEDDTYYDIQRTYVGGLGARLVEISLREAMWLLQKYSNRALKNGYNIPNPIDEYIDLLRPTVIFTDPEMYILDSKQCTPVSTPYEAINYFVMRMFAKDLEAAAVLAINPDISDAFPRIPRSVLYNNKIVALEDADSFSCESLIEAKDVYYLTVCHIQMEQLRIKKIKRISAFPISTVEAAVMLRRTEHISVMTVDEEFEKFSQNSTFMLNWSTARKEENGTLFILYKPDNSHVNSENYSMLNDFYGAYYYNGKDELVLMAPSDEYLGLLEHDIFNSKFGKHAQLIHKEIYANPLLYDYILSAQNHFMDYAENLSD